jgi:hypothetical protein
LTFPALVSEEPENVPILASVVSEGVKLLVCEETEEMALREINTESKNL